MEQNKPNCYKCSYFYITYDTRFPHGCKAYGVQSKYLPSSVIIRTTGIGCISFKEKNKS